MSDSQLLILGPALDPEETRRSLEKLSRVDLPGAIRILITRGKFDTGGAAKTFNVDTGYPAEIPALQTLSTVSGHGYRDDPRFRDGYDLFCIRRLLERQGGVGLLLLLREPDGLDQRWPQLLARASERLFALDSGGNLLLNLAEPDCHAMLELAWTLYRSGAAYALQPYGMAEALATARDALDLAASLRPASGE